MEALVIIPKKSKETKHNFYFILFVCVYMYICIFIGHTGVWTQNLTLAKQVLYPPFFFIWLDWSLDTGLHTCKAGSLQVEPYFQPKQALLALVIFEMEVPSDLNCNPICASSCSWEWWTHATLHVHWLSSDLAKVLPGLALNHDLPKW
jgi:hypothetical protein